MSTPVELPTVRPEKGRLNVQVHLEAQGASLVFTSDESHWRAIVAALMQLPRLKHGGDKIAVSFDDVLHHVRQLAQVDPDEDTEKPICEVHYD